ncbi:MAG TPA: response regulator [Blastocatellia bacterium]|nr:response regulator [Blastocatellia bacterium]
MQTDPPQVNILMVDDNESNLLALEAILQGADRNLVRAASGEAALQYLLYNDAAVILLDVRMPGISGLETAELIRGSKKTRDLPVIFLTAYDSADKEDLSRGYSLGAVDYIIKPLDPEALKSKVAVFVELYKKTEQVKQQAALLHEKNIQLENANFERLGKLVELGQQLTAQRDPETLLQLVCEAAADILGAQNAFVRINGTAGQSARYFVGGGLDVNAPANLERRQIDENALESFSSKTRPIRVPNAGSTKRVRDVPILPWFGSLLSAPISLLGETVGWLYLVDKLDAPEFGEADERLALTLAGQLAVAYENARLYAEAREHAAELLVEVTERKQAEEEKERLLVSEKTARLEAEEALRLSARLLIREENARAEAEAANRLKDEFLATVSHELRTPLNSILGWAQLMRTGTLDGSSSARALMTIERNTKTLAQIIEDLLDVSRIITGKLRLDVRPVELDSVVEAALEAIRPATDAKNILLEVSLDAGVGAVSGDSGRLQQIVWNLLSNAIKFTPSGGQVSVKLERVASGARITVSDSGEGIGEEFLPYVFDRFRQADSTFARMHGGLGLGLAIVRHLVELHGGSVGADSQGKGEGATFTVSFPLLAPERNADAQPGPLVDSGQPSLDEPKDLAGLSVMIVDDEHDARELLVAMLELRGASVIAVSSAAEALETLSNATNGSRPDVLVSDIGMPGQDGFDLIAMVRSMGPERGGDIPAIALTAYASEADRARVLAAGFQRHVAKPVEPSSLATAVASLARRTAKTWRRKWSL